MLMRVSVLLLVFNASLLGLAQQSTTTHSDVSRSLQRMKSANWADREKAFNQMPDVVEVGKHDLAEADRLKVGLIDLLTVENADVSRGNRVSEEHLDYYGNLVGTVSNLNDERAIPALIGAITTGDMARRGLARFGEKALDQVLTENSNPDYHVRSSVLFTIRDLLELHVRVSPSSQAQMVEVVRSSLNDPEFLVRGSAISAIEYFDNRDKFVPALEKVAQTDPVKLPCKPDDGGDGGQFYPLRQQARRLLKKIADHEPPPNDKGLGR